jgi:hypothetical protein
MSPCARQQPKGGIRWLPRAQLDSILAQSRVDSCVLERFPLEPFATLRDRKTHAAFVAAMGANSLSATA